MEHPRTRRQAQAADRREQLLATAFHLFAERGYRGTSVRDIARAVGVTEGLLYHYFAGKAGLFEAVLSAYAPLRPSHPLLDLIDRIPTAVGRAPR